MIIGLPDLKAHLKVDGDDENTLIAAYAAAAEKQVRAWIGRPVYAEAADMPLAGAPGYHPQQILADQAIRVAVLMLAERFYSNRGGEGDGAADAVPPTSVRALLADYRVFAPPAPERGPFHADI